MMVSSVAINGEAFTAAAMRAYSGSNRCIVAPARASLNQTGYEAYSISASGDWITWHKSAAPGASGLTGAEWTCVEGWSGVPSRVCTPTAEGLQIRSAISDEGTVAYQDYRGGDCGGDECVGLFVLRRGGTPSLFVNDGSNPQWVPYADAQRLIALYGPKPAGRNPRQ
ncbi:MAG TPA: hypothetical protein VN690_03200 [Terriglobales bacterium]|nr:hypothetical protein [Terriglobales bacterium]